MSRIRWSSAAAEGELSIGFSITLPLHFFGKIYSRKYGFRPARIKMGLKRGRHNLIGVGGPQIKRPLIFCTLPSNLRDLPPSGFPPVDDEAFLDGMKAFEKGEWRLASARFLKALSKDPDELFSRFYLARSLGSPRPF